MLPLCTAVLFEKINLGGTELRNRFVRSATWEGMCDSEGRPPEKLADLYRVLAREKVGLVITGYTFVSPEGKQMPGGGPETFRFGRRSGWQPRARP